MVWLIGSKGMLGTELARQLSENKINWIGSDCEVDITNPEDLENFAESHDSDANRTGSTVAKKAVPQKIAWVINCAAYTAVDKAEQEAEKATKINVDGARNIARTARKLGAKLIHISTDYVFDGSASSPYTEDTPRSPVGIYATSKANAEVAIEKEMTQYYILRTAWLYGFDGKNFVYTMTRAMNLNDSVKVVNDQRGSPTFAGDLAALIIKIITSSSNAHTLFGKNAALPYGIYHYTDLGEISWYDFAKKIYELGKKYKRINENCLVDPCSTEEYPTPAKRPAYSVLSKEKIQKALKLKIPQWEGSLEKFFRSERFSPR